MRSSSPCRRVKARCCRVLTTLHFDLHTADGVDGRVALIFSYVVDGLGGGAGVLHVD